MNHCEIYAALFRKYGSKLGFNLSQGFIIDGKVRGFDIEKIWEDENR